MSPYIIDWIILYTICINTVNTKIIMMYYLHLRRVDDRLGQPKSPYIVNSRGFSILRNHRGISKILEELTLLILYVLYDITIKIMYSKNYLFGIYDRNRVYLNK